MGEARSKVVLSEHLDEAAAEWLGRRVRLVRQSHEDAAGLARELADAEGLVVRTYTIVDEKMLKGAGKLKVVARAGVGLDNIDLEACRKRGVRVVYTPDANTQAVVEYVTALVLDAVRPRVGLAGYVAPPTFHKLRAECVGRQLDELVLGIWGMGRIGRRVAQVAHAMGMRVLYYDVLTRAQLKLGDGEPSEFVDRATLLRESDILTIHVDGRAENRHMVDGAALGKLRPGCVLINTSRGMVIEPGALAAWAKRVEGKGGMAVLDVHDPEPPPDDYALWGLGNVRLLPHLASRTHRAMSNMSWVVRDVAAVLEGVEPSWPAV